MLESQIQSKIIKFLKSKEHFCYKHLATSVNGIPDIMCIIKGIPVFIEVKRPGGKATELQMVKITEITENGGIAFITHSYESFMQKYEELRLFFEMHEHNETLQKLQELNKKLSLL